jgi:hypothetical protein
LIFRGFVAYRLRDMDGVENGSEQFQLIATGERD